ncbi:DMT family transporter [Amycolatopsis keratiniphila]|uniref:EamA family transporter n=1 Tax=Amycolatopsis keratiniphila subsp. keratiniphila TaxID=227715 RepID=A0A1W2LWD6_9PSEU|nr:DMT family transporter [Amycolatopsis keratiniphila]ONF70771.1 EamA family transporter [Amycolatopsis keratiniphila subsp. keratiniphila]
MRHNRILIDPRVQGVLGALAIALSAPLVALSGVSSTTATFFRCLFALPILVILARSRERGRRPSPAARRRHVLAGVLLGIDMVLWSEAILSVGAGVATALVNVQVVLVPLAGLRWFGERPPRAFWLSIPVMLAGTALAGGLADGGAAGSDPWYGTVMAVLAGVAYAGYLILLRRAGTDGGGRTTMLATATAASASVGGLSGLFAGNLDATPPVSALLWLFVLAVTGQVLGWLLIGRALSALPASGGSAVLMLQPAAAILFGAALLGQWPTPLQLAGCALVVAAVGAVSFLAGRSSGNDQHRPVPGPDELGRDRPREPVAGLL